MQHDPLSIPAQVLVTTGRFRDNRRGVIDVHATADGMAEIVIRQAGAFDVPDTTTRIVLADSHLRAMIDGLESALTNRTRLEVIA